MKILELQLKKDVLIVQPDERGNINSWIALHSKKWNFICLGLELTEEIASELVEVDYSNFQSDDENYELKKNYVKDTFEFMSFEESFISAVKSKGFYWLKHNVRSFSLYDPRSKTGWHDLEEEDTITKQWQEAEEKTFRNPVIFIKKS